VVSVESVQSDYIDMLGGTEQLVLVKNWVEFWRWQSKVIEKKWQEGNWAVQRKLHMWFEVTMRLL
jgi:hypothetical protein